MAVAAVAASFECDARESLLSKGLKLTKKALNFAEDHPDNSVVKSVTDKYDTAKDLGSCDLLDDDEACARLSDHYAQGDDKDDQKAHDYAVKACGINGKWCEKYGVSPDSKSEDEPMPEKGAGDQAAAQQEPAGDAKAQQAPQQPSAQEAAQPQPESAPKAADAQAQPSSASKVCSASTPEVCRQMVENGIAFETGKGAKQDYRRAAELYYDACKGGYAGACVNLGLLYDEGNGLKKSPDRALKLYKQACDVGSSDGCFNAALSYEGGQGIAKDEAMAADFYARACKLGDPSGCYNLGAAYYEGAGMPKSKETAIEYLHKSCDLGYQDGCKAAASLKGK